MIKKVGRLILIVGLGALLIWPGFSWAQNAGNGVGSGILKGTTPAPAIPPTATPTCDGRFNPADVFKADGLLPPFLRSADAAQNADFSCLGAGIAFYTSFLALVIGLMAFVYLLYGAFLYITAFGDDAKATQAKKVITQALTGVIIATLAYSIISFVNAILHGGASLPGT